MLISHDTRYQWNSDYQNKMIGYKWVYLNLVIDENMRESSSLLQSCS